MLNETILIVDNNIESRNSLKDIIQRSLEYTLIDVTRLDEARQKLSRFQPFLIILAGTNPFDQVQAFITDYAPTAAIMLIQVHVSTLEMQTALHAGARDVLIRPLEADRLLRAIERIHQQRQVEIERDALLTQTKSQAEEFGALHAVGKKTSALLDIEEILTTVVGAAVALTHAEQGSLMLLDQDTGELYLRASQN